MVRQSKRAKMETLKTETPKMETSKSLSSFPNEILQLTFSFLPTKALPEVGQVCRKFAPLAKVELAKRRKDDKDWRLEFIQKKKFDKEISPLMADKFLEKAKRKDSAFTERLIFTREWRSDYKDIQMTENILAYTGRMETVGSNGKKKKKHFINVERRSDGAKFTITLGEHDRFEVWNWSIVVLANGLKVSTRTRETAKFIYWIIPEVGRRKRKKIYKIEPTRLVVDFNDYYVNGDYLLLKYDTYLNMNHSQHEELWHMMDPSPVQIELPNIALFCGENESIEENGYRSHRLGNGWIMDTNKNSQFLVRACKLEIPVNDSERFSFRSREYFVLVFSGFDTPKYLHRITATTFESSGFHDFDIRLTVVGENESATTLLMVDCHELDYNEFDQNQEMRAFDMTTGLALFTRRYGEHSSFVCSRYTRWWKLSDYAYHQDVVAKLLWINWTGKDWSISETDVPLPIHGNKTTLRSVTDTRILWDVEGRKGRTCIYISYDYLLPDLEGTLMNTDKDTWLNNFYKEDYKSDSEEEDNDEHN